MYLRNILKDHGVIGPVLPCLCLRCTKKLPHTGSGLLHLWLGIVIRPSREGQLHLIVEFLSCRWGMVPALWRTRSDQRVWCQRPVDLFHPRATDISARKITPIGGNTALIMIDGQ